MKRIKAIAFFTLALIVLMGSTAASQYTPKYGDEADILCELGLFTGTDEGYELDRAPTRIEALVLIIRLLGADAQAKNCQALNPFPDVPLWADRYVAWAYDKGLIKDVPDAHFEGMEKAEAGVFLTFILRALGYDDSSENFSAEEAVDKAEEIGLISDGAYRDKEAKFLRDDCVHICFSALTRRMKSGVTLAEQLVAQGVISMEDAVKFGLLSPGKSYLVACIGDSITSGFGLKDPASEAYPAVLSTLEGEYAFTTESYAYSMLTVDLESRLSYSKSRVFDKSMKTEADIILVALGTNDAIWSGEQTDFAEDYEELLNMYINLPGAPRVIAMTPPRLFGLESYSELMAEIAEEERTVAGELGLDIIDIYAFSESMETEKYCDENLHMNVVGHRLVAGFIYDELCGILSD